MKMKKVLTANLKPGMVSSEAAYTYSNHLVIQSNTVLTSEIIEKLKYYAVKAVKVYVQEDAVPNQTVEPLTQTYYERVQASPEFKQFETKFTDCIDNFKQELNDIVTKSSDGLVDSMLNEGFNL